MLEIIAGGRASSAMNTRTHAHTHTHTAVIIMQHANAHTQTHMQAFCRQANLLARNVQRGERNVKRADKAANTSQHVHEVW